MQSHRKFSDGFSDTSSSGNFMDETDREVSNLTDRAFRSLCVGEEAIYNDSEFSSPTERHKAFVEEQQQNRVVQMSSQVKCSYGVQQHGEVRAQSETASTFQHSYVDVTQQEQVLQGGGLSCVNNGTKEMTWQQSRSSSRVSSLIKAFSSGDCYQDSGTCDVLLARDKHLGHESWDKSTLLSMQREVSEFSSGFHQNFKSGPFQTYRNHFYTSELAAAVAQMDTKAVMKSSKSKYKALNSTNRFFHSEFSPFQLWEDYNRFTFESMKSGFISANEFPRWYDSPMYKELKDPHGLPNYENRRFNQRQTQDVAHSQRSRSTVIQKAFAIEKRCESEMVSNCPAWKKGINFVKNKLPNNRPSTVSPTYEKTCRPDSSLFGNSNVFHEIQHKVVNSVQPNSVTPFSITQLLTPVIHSRQETETSEILQYANTPSISEYSPQGETDPKPQANAKHLRDSYKSRASSLLFNLKDNRRRVKSTYSPPKFKGLEVTDRNKQPSKLEGRESRFSDILGCEEMNQENSIETYTWERSSNPKESSKAHVTAKNDVDAIVPYDNLTSTHIQDGAIDSALFSESSQGHFLSTDLLTNTESTQCELSSQNLSILDKSSLTSEGQSKDLNSNVIPTRPEIANVLPKTHSQTNSLPSQTSVQQRCGPGNTGSQNDPKQDFGKKTHFEYSQNATVKERSQWDQTHDSRCEVRPFRGEIAALIEMDKQRKAIAKQYLPSTNNSYSVRKETYMQKVNDDIKLGRLSTEEKVEDTISSWKTSYKESPVHNNIIDTSKAIDLYGAPKNNQNKRSSPPKEVKVYSGSQIYAVKDDLAKEKQLSEKAPELYDENKTNSELSSYQPYKYEVNHQNKHTTSANELKHSKDNADIHSYSGKTSQMQHKSNKISNTMLSSRQSTQHTTISRNMDAASKPALQETDTAKNSDQNHPCLLSGREEKLSINDILAKRDCERAGKMRENSSSGDLARSKIPQNLIKYNTTEEKVTRTSGIKEQDAQGYMILDHTAPVYPRKDVHNLDEGLTNMTADKKDKLMSKNSERVTARALSHKERIQIKQEILTSKLKAHAQKEISAIKEKELARQALLARNMTKPSTTLHNETAQDGQEVHFARKEITADKLDHLFQDITYSSVTQHKELNKTQNDHRENESPQPRDQQPKESHSQNDIQATALESKSEYKKRDNSLKSERELDSVKYDKPSSDDKEINKEAQNVRVGDCTTVNNIKDNGISDNKQISRKSPEDIKRKERLSIKSPCVHTSPIDTKSNNKSPALHCKKQPDLNLNKTSDVQCGYLDINVEEATVRHESKITAAVERSKNEHIQNRSEIKVSQLTSLSNDMMLKNGNPPAKLLSEYADSKHQTDTENADGELFKKLTCRHSSELNRGTTPTSLTENIVRKNSGTTNELAPRTKRLETLEYLVKDEEIARSKNDLQQKQNKMSPVKDVKHFENKMMERQTEAETSFKSEIEIVSQNSKESCQQKDEKEKTLVSVTKNETHKTKVEIDELSRDESLPESFSHSKKEGHVSRSVGTLSEESERVHERFKDAQKVTSENTKCPIDSLQKVDSTQENAPIQHEDMIKPQKNNIQPVARDKSDSTKTQLSVSTPSKDEHEEEPMIFSICVSSKTETISDDEPMIYTICVSSKSQLDEQQNPVKPEDRRSEECVTKAEEEESVKHVQVESKKVGNGSSGQRDTKVSVNKVEKEHVVKKSERPLTLDKQEHRKPSEIGRIGTSYENLLAKYGLPVRNQVNTSKHHMEDNKDIKEKQTEVSPSVKHEINRSQEKTSGNTQERPEESRSASLHQQGSLRATQLLKENDIKMKQQAYSSIQEKHHDIPSVTQNDKPKLSPSLRDASVKTNDTANAEQCQDIENIEAMQQRRKNSNVQLKDKNTEEQVRNTEKVQRLRKTENISEDKSPLNTENVSLTAKQTAASFDLNVKMTAKTLNTPVSKATVTKHTINTKLNETSCTEQTYANKTPQKMDGKDRRSLLPPNPTTNETQNSAKQDNCVAVVKCHCEKEGFVEKKAQPDQRQAGFNTHNDITDGMKMVPKDGAAAHVNTYMGKVNSLSEDVCAIVKHNKDSCEVSKIHFEDVKVSTEEMSSRHEFMVNREAQHVVTKTEESLGMRVPLKCHPTEIMDDLKVTGEMTARLKEYNEKGITPPKKDSPVRVPQETVQDSDKSKEDSSILSLSGRLYNKDGNLQDDEKESGITGEKEITDGTMKIKLNDTTNKYQSEKDFTEMEESASYNRGCASQQGIKAEPKLSKPEAPQRTKRLNRPEISALADYARLKVISAEDDIKEFDIFPKRNVYQSHEQSVAGLNENSHGHESLLGGESKGNTHMEEIVKSQNSKQKSLQLLERDRDTLQTLNQSQPSLSPAQNRKKPTAFGSSAIEGLRSTRETVLTSRTESNPKPVLMEQTNKNLHHNHLRNLQEAKILPLQTESRSNPARSIAAQEKENIGKPKTLANLPLCDAPARLNMAENSKMTSPAVEETEELQYYTVNAFDHDTKQTPEPHSSRHTITPNKDLDHKLEGEKKEESSLLHSLTDHGKVNVTGQRSNSSSPSMGKPILFKVKDNTMRASSVTKTVKPCFHRSFSDDFKFGSPKENLSEDEEHNEPANPPVLQEPVGASHRLYKMRDTQNKLPSVEHIGKQLKSHQRRSQNLDDDDARSVLIMMSEDVENITASIRDTSDFSVASLPKFDSYADTYKRPASACYERPESSCYERPESACSDMRPLGKPPTVPPKTEKALRRAQRLTTRRMKKVDNKTTDQEPIRNASSSPSDLQSKHPAVQAMPPVSGYITEPTYTTPAHSLVAQPFTMTQRKLLQDPNSGQYFMVDMPLPVKTKTFYDPETGKYVQLNVRQRSQSVHSQPTSVEVLNGAYMLYPGFLPVAASSLPAVRSSSQLSAPSTQTNNGGSTELWKQNQQNQDSQREPAHRSCEQTYNTSRNVQQRSGERKTDIITMSELEDFAMENT